MVMPTYNKIAVEILEIKMIPFLPNLDKIAQLIKEFDIVALQEVDAGSLRSQFINQTEYLAKKADFFGTKNDFSF